ncbi:MAG: phosphotriesterase family protein [Opitutaceae bacterium]
MHRRTFLGLLGGAALAPRLPAASSPPATIETVRGPVPAAEIGLTLPHEHVLVDFIGAAAVAPSRYDADEVFRVALPHLEKARALGVETLVECTPAYVARDPKLLARLSEASGLHVLTNTGLYGARKNLFLPPYAFTESARALAGRWIAEARDGIEDTGIHPGFIKCGIDPEPELSDIHRKLAEAAALTHLATGLTIAIHTGAGPGLALLDILREHGAAPAAFIWTHAQNASDDSIFAAADQGAWISLDGLRPRSLEQHLRLCALLKARGHLAQILLSHDAGWFDPAKPGGGNYRGYEFLFETVLPRLRKTGFTPAELDLLLVENPARAFTNARRLL